jgi:hypothetical protein
MPRHGIHPRGKPDILKTRYAANRAGYRYGWAQPLHGAGGLLKLFPSRSLRNGDRAVAIGICIGMGIRQAREPGIHQRVPSFFSLGHRIREKILSAIPIEVPLASIGCSSHSLDWQAG